MTRDLMPSISCDGDDGLCGRIESDYFEGLADSVNGVRITSTTRAPGWTSEGDEDFCPKHNPNTTSTEDPHV
jgi:hypothetical protein